VTAIPTEVPIVVETAPKRTFVAATDWPGWSRGGRDERGALDAQLTYATRYAAVVKGVAVFDTPTNLEQFRVVERLAGGSGTEFGIPYESATADLREIDEAELARQIAILRASRRAFDAAAKAAVGVSLRTGPRGGGRQLEKIVRHVVEADEAYLRQLGTRAPKWGSLDVAGYAAQVRRLQDEAFAARVRGTALPDANAVQKPWVPRYFVRRAAWHLLDHAWEIEDRAAP
jgi:hypothetical protein